MNIQSKENARGAHILLGMSGSELHVLCCAHITDVSENILHRVYSAQLLIAQMSEEMKR